MGNQAPHAQSPSACATCHKMNILRALRIDALALLGTAIIPPAESLVNVRHKNNTSSVPLAEAYVLH